MHKQKFPIRGTENLMRQMTDIHRPIDLNHKISELKRELRMREHLYPRWVASAKLKKEDADRRIAVLRTILTDYKDQIPKQNDLFEAENKKKTKAV